jgi:hypothetical protein
MMMMRWSGTRPCAIILALLGTVILASPVLADTPDCMNGQWKDTNNDGGTLTLTWTGTELDGNGTGGQGHTTLTNHFALKQVNGNTFTGTYTNQEGAVSGWGNATIVMNGGDGNGIQVKYSGQWSGGGQTNVPVSGTSQMTRVTGRACR